MSREWKAGDVAMATATGGQFLVVRTGHGERAYWSAPMDWPRGVSDYECEFRPLVVIDPEDREAVERLADYLDSAYSLEYAQQRLREYANPKPPRPDEPQGLGAVVEDEDGYLYVRGYVNGESTHEWHVIDPASNKRMGWWKYDDFAAVRVLSPGVEVDQ